MKNNATENKEINNYERATEGPPPRRARCRIPQRTTPSSARPRIAQTNKPTSSQGSCSRSSNRSDNMSVKQLHAPRTSRPEILPTSNMKNVLYKKAFNSTKRVPNSQKMPKGYQAGVDQLPDQETIKKREDIELQKGYKEIQGSKVTTVAELRKVSRDTVPTQEVPDVLQVKSSWTKNLTQFETLKHGLQHQQKTIIELYAKLKNTHKIMLGLGQKVNLPSFEELQIMNVAKLAPDQLLQLCAAGSGLDKVTSSSQQIIAVDLNKLVDMPSKLVATCELTLQKRKEIIDWFQTLKSEEKGISMSKLTKKINEFNAENEMLACSLTASKTVFLKELSVLVDYLRKGVNEAVALQVRIEELTYEISELNTKNGDLRKQLQATEHLKSPHNKFRIEELEKELKEEKCKKTVIKDRLSRAEGQVKIANERALQLESALEQARSQNWTLERTVQQLHEQNQKLQIDFDKELCKLRASIKDNTLNLEQIAVAREKLQAEKEDLEKRLQELSENYNETLSKMKEELITNIANLTVTEKKFEEETEERKNLESKFAELCSQLLESEVRYKNILNQIQEKDDQISKLTIAQSELEATNKKLEAANCELMDYKDRFLKQSQAIREIEHNFQEAVKLEKSLKLELVSKQNYINELENVRSLLEQKLQEGENKMETYEKQLKCLKGEIAQVHEKFGEFENMNELHEMINEQRDKLIEITRQNGDLAKALQQKDLELECRLDQIAKQQQIFAQKDGLIKKFSEKEEEQLNIIKLLRSNMEKRAKTDCDLNQQLAEKNAEIDSLANNLETRKTQVLQLEQIILTLEEQLRKVYLQRKKDQNRLTMLEKAITDYDAFPEEIHPCNEMPAENLDDIIKTLEDELGASFEPLPLKTHKICKKKKYVNKKNLNEPKYNRTENCAEKRIDNLTSTLEDKDSSQSITRNTTKRNRDQENLGRKQAIMNIGTQCLPNAPSIEYKPLADRKGAVKVVQIMTGRQDDRKCKMLKLAVHNL